MTTNQILNKKRPINFHYNLFDSKERTAKTIIIQEEPNYLAKSFIKIPIYSDVTNEKIGYRVSNQVIKQVQPELFLYRHHITFYFLENNSSITWLDNFESKSRLIVSGNTEDYSTIESATGEYVGSKGTVSLVFQENGDINITIIFNVN